MTEEIRNILLGAFVLALAITAAWPVKAQDHHPLHKDFYQHWKQPGTDIGCCNARVAAPFGGETGDCEPTKAEIRNGQWFAWLRQESRWLPVPDAKVIRGETPTSSTRTFAGRPTKASFVLFPQTQVADVASLRRY